MQINTYLWFAIDANDNRRVLGLSISIINMSIYKEDNSTRGGWSDFFLWDNNNHNFNFKLPFRLAGYQLAIEQVEKKIHFFFTTLYINFLSPSLLQK